MGDPSPDNVIDLTLDDYEDDTVLVDLYSVRKRIRSSIPPAARNSSTLIKKVKTEGGRKVKAEPSAPLDNNNDGEIEILDHFPQDETTLSPPAAASSKSNNNNNANEDDIAVVGTRNHHRLPHARQHCTEKPFQIDTGYSLAASRAVNSEVCDCCYCYVCDVPATECKGNWNEDHCLATDQGQDKAYWAKRRADGQTNGLPAPAAASGAAAAAASAGAARHLRHECPHHAFNYEDDDEGYDSDDFVMGKPKHSSDTNKHYCPGCYCYLCDKPSSECLDWDNVNPYYSSYYGQHCNAYPDGAAWEEEHKQVLIRSFGPGPFAPDHKAIEVDKTLTKCRHCEWYSRPDTTPIWKKPATMSNDEGLCGACGRVADAKNLGKKQGIPYKPKPEDLFLGTKKVSFTLRTQDPREVAKYATRWKDNSGKAGWIYDEKSHTQEVFQHRLGPRPSLSRILSCVVCDSTKKNTTHATSSSGASTYGNKNNIIQLENQWDHVMMKELKNTTSTSFGPHHYGWINGEIEASWDSAKSRGVRSTVAFVALRSWMSFF